MAEPHPLGGRLPAVPARVPAAAPAAAPAPAVHVGAVAAPAASTAGGGSGGGCRCRRRRAVLGVALVVVVVVGEELALGVRDGEVAEDVLSGRGTKSKVFLLCFKYYFNVFNLIGFA